MKQTYKILPEIPTQLVPPAPTHPRLQRLFNLTEVGEYLRLGPRPLMKAIASGKLVSSFVGRSHLVSEAAIEAYLANQEGQSPYGKKPKTRAAITEASNHEITL